MDMLRDFNGKEGYDLRSPRFVKTTVKAGNSDQPKKGDTVHVHYVGTLANGDKFDSSRDRGKCFTFVVGIGSVIKGWDEGLLQMTVGEKANLVCPPDYAYGADSPSPKIPANSTLYFEVELLQIGGSPPAEDSCSLF